MKRNGNKGRIKELLSEALKWDVPKMADAEGYPKPAIDVWQNKVAECLRDMPDGVRRAKEFIRLQRYAHHNWVTDMASRKERAMLVEKIIDDSISYLKGLLDK